MQDLEKEKATHSSTFALKISWTEEPDELQSMGSQRVRTWLSMYIIMKSSNPASEYLNKIKVSKRYFYCHMYWCITHNRQLWKQSEYPSVDEEIRKMWYVHTMECSVKWLSPVQLFVTTWTIACQASLSITNSQSLLKLMYIELVMPSSHLILCCPLLLLPSIFPSIRVFFNGQVFVSGGQSTGASASVSVLPMNI